MSRAVLGPDDLDDGKDEEMDGAEGPVLALSEEASSTELRDVLDVPQDEPDDESPDQLFHKSASLLRTAEGGESLTEELDSEVIDSNEGAPVSSATADVDDSDRMEVDSEAEPPEVTAEERPTCIVALDSLKYQDYPRNDDQRVVRVTHKDIQIDAVTFHERSLQIDFRCLQDSDPLLQKYGVPKWTELIWHAELAFEIVPEECEMRGDDREFVLKKKNPSEWNSSLLQCNSTSAISSSSYASNRPYSSRTSTSYRFSSTSSSLPSGLPPTPGGHVSSYHRSAYTPSSRPTYSPHTYIPTSSTYSSSSSVAYSPTVRSRSTSSIVPRSSASSLATTAPSTYSHSRDFPSSSTAISPRPPSVPSTPHVVRPTAKVSPYDEQGTVVDPGFTGLRNIGNTCFMNATLQMLVNCKELQIFFTGDYYKRDINMLNPLGFGGRLAEVFADFMKHMWSGMNRAFEPTKVKELVAEKASQFANFAQHDAHEFLSFLLDGLHEDLNRVRSKPYTTTVEAAGRPDVEVANESWGNHLLRNDSIFVDLFHGQLKSRLQCPKCEQVSVTFDPFVYLAVPFPKEKRSSTVFFWPLDPCLKPIRLAIRYSSDGTVSEMLSAVSQIVNVATKSLRMAEVSNHTFMRLFQPGDSVNQIRTSDVIYVFQVHDPTDCHEPVIEFVVVQRLLFRRSLLRACANCHLSDEKLKSCERCYDALYCKRECQVEHWTKEHKMVCKQRPQADPVGQPFIISLPKSKATYANIFRNLESRCKHSVNVFQPPVESNNNPGTAVDLSESREGSMDLSLSPSSSLSSIGSNGNTTSSPSTLSSGSGKRQMVLGEPRNKSRPESRLFLIRKMQQQDSVVGETLQENKQQHEPFDLPSETFLSMFWHNMRFGKDYLTVETKDELEVDTAKTALYQKIASEKAGASSSASSPSLGDMLAMFSETERLKPEESWYCNKCKEHVEATKQLVLYRLPPILIIQLKRFVYTTSIISMHRRSKDDRPVQYPVNELDLSDFLCNSAPSGQETKYDLTGVVCHSGSSYFGHYISMGRLESLDGKSTEIEWRNFDDSVVSRIPPSRVQNDDAYLLFYKQRGNATQKLLNKRYGIETKS